MDGTKKDNLVTAHIPVLLQDVIDVLDLSPGDYVVDGTAGGGGHASAIMKALREEGRYLGIDADQSALDRVRAKLGSDPRVALVCGNFKDIEAHMEHAHVHHANKVLLDLGLSSDQLEARSGRGFSFMVDEPLRMTFALAPIKGTLTAWHVVNEWSEESLADIIYGFGGDRKSRRIARAIVASRAEEPIETSRELADIIEHAVGRKKGAHPATRTFQAIRIAVNDELGVLKEALGKVRTLLEPGGRVAIITFHSLEDRIVKQTFVAWEKEGIGKRVTKRPIAPSRKECTDNRRARSAKLRCFEKAK